MEENAHRQALEAMWRARLVNTRTRYEAAKATVQAARELQSQIPGPGRQLCPCPRATGRMSSLGGIQTGGDNFL